MKRIYSKLLAIAGLIIMGGGNARADEVVTVGRTYDLSQPSATEYTITSAENVTVSQADGSGVTELFSKGVYYKSKESVSISSKLCYKNVTEYDANVYAGFKMEVASGYIFSLSQIKASIAASANFSYRIEIAKEGNTTALYNSNDITITDYKTTNATNVDFKDDNISQTLEAGTYYVKLHYWFNGSGKYLVPLELTVTGTVAAKAFTTDDATLSSISVNGTPIEGFSPETTSYNVDLPYGTTTAPEITAATTSSGATYTVTSNTLQNGATIIVTSADNTATKTYTITYNVADKSPDASATVKVNDTDTELNGTTYSVTFKGYEESTANVTITPTHEKATVTVGETTGVAGAAVNTTMTLGSALSFTVTAEDGTVVNYTLTVNNEKIISTATVWDLSEAKSGTSELDGLYFSESSGVLNDTEGNIKDGNVYAGLKGLKINSSFYARFNVPQSTTGKLIVTYAPRFLDQTISITVNGENAQTITEETTQSFDIYNAEEIRIERTAGEINEGGLLKLVWVPDAEIVLNAEGYATYSNAADVEITGAKAYSAKADAAAAKITCTEIGTTIPANTGVLLYGEANATVTIKAASGEVTTTIENNDLKPVVEDMAKPEGYVYVLNGSSFLQFTGERLTVNKAYFLFDNEVTIPSGSKLVIYFDETTGISNVDAEISGSDAPIYNLAGQRVGKSVKGILIQNGRKFINK